MQRAELIEVVRSTMAQAGFAVSERCDLRPVSFDLVARRDKDLVILKILTNVDALGEEIAREIRILSKFLEARPILVGLRAGQGVLEDGVVYTRHDIPIVTPGTLAEQFLHSDLPMVFAAPGGLYVHLQADTLRRARETQNVSLGVLAQIAGVSRRAIQMYEEGMSASIEAAMRLEEFLQQELIRPSNPLEFESTAKETTPDPGSDPMEAFITQILQSLGYEVQATRRSPFNAISQQENTTVLTGIGADSPLLRRRARIVESVSRIVERPGFFVMERTTRTSLEGMPVINRDELRRLRDPERILELILERSRRSD